MIKEHTPKTTPPFRPLRIRRKLDSIPLPLENRRVAVVLGEDAPFEDDPDAELLALHFRDPFKQLPLSVVEFLHGPGGVQYRFLLPSAPEVAVLPAENPHWIAVHRPETTRIEVYRLRREPKTHAREVLKRFPFLPEPVFEAALSEEEGLLTDLEEVRYERPGRYVAKVSVSEEERSFEVPFAPDSDLWDRMLFLAGGK